MTNFWILVILSVLIIALAKWADKQCGFDDDDDYPTFI